MAEEVSPSEALARSIDNWVREQSSMAESYLAPKLPDLVARIEQDLNSFGLEIVRKKQ